MTFSPILENPYSYLYLKETQKETYSDQDLLTSLPFPMLNTFIHATVILQGTPDQASWYTIGSLEQGWETVV